MHMLRSRLLMLLLLASLGLNGWVAYKWWYGRRPGVMPDIERSSRARTKADLFQLIPVEAGDIVLLGDSHFEYFPIQELLDDLPVVNRGVSGETTAEIALRLGPILEAAPARVVLLAGANDIFQERSEDDLAAEMRGMVERCARAKVNVTVLSIPPNAMPAVQDRIDAANRRLAGVCAEHAVPYVDLDPVLRNGDLIDPALTFDGLHLNAAGYMRLANVLRNALSAERDTV